MPAHPLARGVPSRSPAERVEDASYPCSDGKPMADNMWQAEAIMNAAGDLKEVHPHALVAADILVYPVEGDRNDNIAPDVLVAFGLETHKRGTYLVWVEGKPPDWVLEVASRSTQKKDREYKLDYYAQMGVPEYWWFDPRGKLYPRGTPSLQGHELVDGKYRPLVVRIADGERLIHSAVLGLDVRAEDELLRFRDPKTGRDIQHRPEVAAQLRRETAQREAAVVRAEAAVVRADAAVVRAEAAETRAATAESRIAELEAALRRSRGSHSP